MPFWIIFANRKQRNFFIVSQLRSRTFGTPSDCISNVFNFAWHFVRHVQMLITANGAALNRVGKSWCWNRDRLIRRFVYGKRLFYVMLRWTLVVSYISQPNNTIRRHQFQSHFHKRIIILNWRNGYANMCMSTYQWYFFSMYTYTHSIWVKVIIVIFFALSSNHISFLFSSFMFATVFMGLCFASQYLRTRTTFIVHDCLFNFEEKRIRKRDETHSDWKELKAPFALNHWYFCWKLFFFYSFAHSTK